MGKTKTVKYTAKSAKEALAFLNKAFDKIDNLRDELGTLEEELTKVWTFLEYKQVDNG